MPITFDDVDFDNSQRLLYEGRPVNGEVWDVRRDGSVAAIQNFKFGVQHGLSRAFHANGTLAFEGEYEFGLRRGVHRFWSEDGVLQREVEYDARGMKA